MRFEHTGKPNVIAGMIGNRLKLNGSMLMTESKPPSVVLA